MKKHSTMRRTSLFASKKAAEDMLTDFFAILAFAVIVLITFFLIGLERDNAEKKVKEDFSGQGISFMLDSFLRAPYLPDKSKTIAQVIGEDSMDDNFDRTMKLYYSFFKSTNNIDGVYVQYMYLCITKDGSTQTGFSRTIDSSGGSATPAYIEKISTSVCDAEDHVARASIVRPDGKIIGLSLIVYPSQAKYEQT